jgi:hypothetical protein
MGMNVNTVGQNIYRRRNRQLPAGLKLLMEQFLVEMQLERKV